MASSFNQPLGWNTSSVTDMSGMFDGAGQFSQDLSAWDVGRVTNFADMFRGTRMASEFASGARHTNPCRIHQSWQAQNPTYWNATLAFGIPGITDAFCVPYLPGGALHGDPHLAFAHGGRADFRGCDGCYFSLLSAADLAVNMRTEDAHFRLHGAEVHGSFVTEVHVAWRAPDATTWLNLSYVADNVGEGNWGWEAVRATCGGRRLRTYPKTFSECAGAELTLDYSSLVLVLPEWSVRLGSRPVYDRIDGPHHRLDMKFVPRVPEHKLSAWPHGLIGQSFDGDGAPLSGREDEYVGDEVWTSAMAEGAIEGTWRDYLLDGPFATGFRFSRFGAAPGSTRPRDAGALKAAAAVPLRFASATAE